MDSQAAKERAPVSERDAGRLTGHSDESLQGSPQGRPSPAQALSPSSLVASRLTPDAASVYSAASVAWLEGSDEVSCRLPSRVFRTADRQGGTYHLAYTRGSRDEQPGRPACMYIVVLYPERLAQGVYDTAHVEGGSELAVEPVKHECADGYETEHLLIQIPDEVLAQHAATGVHLRVSRRSSEGMQFILEVPASHVEALLALRFPQGFPERDASAAAAASSIERLDQAPTDALKAVDATPEPNLVAEPSAQADETAIQTAPVTPEASAAEPLQHAHMSALSLRPNQPVEHLPANPVVAPSPTLSGLAADAGAYAPGEPTLFAADRHRLGRMRQVAAGAGTNAHGTAEEPLITQRPLDTPRQLERAPVIESRVESSTLARMSKWPMIVGLGVLAGFVAWRFFLAGELPSPQQSSTQPQQALPQDSTAKVQPGQQSPAGSASSASDARAAVRTFVDEWFKAGNSGSAEDLMRFYAPKVDYYQRGFVPRAYIASDKAQLLRRWPTQDNKLEGAITVTQGHDESRATFLFSYWLENGRQIRNGRARVLLAVQERDGRYYIVRENAIALDAAGIPKNIEFYWRHESSF